MAQTPTYPNGTWINADGLPVRLGRSAQLDAVVGKPTQFGVEQILEAEIVWDRLPAFTAAEDHGMIYGGYPSVSIPKGALIKSAILQVTTGESAASSQTLSVGLVKADGTEIDNDGLIDATAQSTVDTTGKTVTGAGALIGTKTSDNGYLWVSVQTANFTTLVAKLSVTYYMPPLDKNNS